MRKIRLLYAALSFVILIAFDARIAVALRLAHTLTGMDFVRTEYGLCGAGQTVAIIDTGIAYDHRALGGGYGTGFRVVGGGDFTDDLLPNPDDVFGAQGGHGTHVAGVIGANLGDQNLGVAPRADMVALRVVNSAGESYYSWIEAALNWVLQNRNNFASPITTVNISNGSLWNGAAPPDWATLEEELSALQAQGVFVSVSAGNSFTEFNEPGLNYPAASPHVVAAMSVDDNGQLSYFSQRHDRALAAPGRSIRTTRPDYEGNNDGVVDDFGSYSGTNLAAPYLAGASVIVREAMEIVGVPVVNQQAIYDHLRNTSDLVFDPATGQQFRRLNMATAITALMPPDDVGSSVETARDMGRVAESATFSGLIGSLADRDFFSFTPATTGIASLTTVASHFMQPAWTIIDDAGVVLAQRSGNQLSFPVVANSHYWIALSAGNAIGRYQTQLDLQPRLIADYDGDLEVDVDDFELWRVHRGSTTNLAADGNGDGVVDRADYHAWLRVVWSQGLINPSLPSGLRIPEPSAAALFGCCVGIACRRRPPR